MIGFRAHFQHISYHAFSSPSSEERGESEILIAYLVLLSSTHLRPLPAHFKNKPVQKYFFKSKSTSQTKHDESLRSDVLMLSWEFLQHS